jgi:hypothetical protein
VGVLQRFEHRLEQVVSGAFAKAFRSAVQPVELAAALQREVDNSAQVMSRERRLAPNTFMIELSPLDHERLVPYSTTLGNELVEVLREHAEEQHYVFAGPVTIAFELAEDLGTGRFRVRSAAAAKVEAEVAQIAPPVGDARVVLEVNGSSYPVIPPGLIIGRGSEADLRVNDPGVSRKHAEIRMQPGRARPQIGVVDLNSTNGTFVDGRRVERSVLDDGAEITVGHSVITVRFTESPDV